MKINSYHLVLISSLLFHLNTLCNYGSGSKCLSLLNNSINLNSEIAAETYPKIHTRDLKWYLADLGLTFKTVLNTLTNDKSKSFTLIDAGAGLGIFTLDISQKYSNAVTFALNRQNFWTAIRENKINNIDYLSKILDHFKIEQSLDFETRKSKLFEKIDKLRQSKRFHYLTDKLAEDILSENRYKNSADIITSFYGDFTYSPNKIQVIKAHLKALKPGGYAFYQYDRKPTFYPAGLASQSVRLANTKNREFSLFDILMIAFPNTFSFEWVDNPNNRTKHHIMIMKKPLDKKKTQKLEDLLDQIVFQNSETEIFNLGFTFSGRSKGSFELIHSHYEMNTIDPILLKKLIENQTPYPPAYPE